MYIPETDPSTGTVSAKYITSKISLEDATVSFRLLFSAVVQYGASIEVYYKTQTPYNTDVFGTVLYCSTTYDVAKVVLDSGAHVFVLYSDLEKVENNGS